MLINLFNCNTVNETGDFVKPWRPRPLDHSQWPPDYRAVYAWRLKTLSDFNSDPTLIFAAKLYYSTRPTEFIMHWLDTYDPRKTSLKWIPFVFFTKQADVIEFFHEMRTTQESGLVEKCRDYGLTWLACGYSIWSFLFIPHDSIGWGSRKAMLVDELGNPDSIFEKMRLMLRRLPKCFLPVGWNEKKHTAHMKFVNPESGATINGEAGDNIGRGGRKSVYFVDEAAHLERPEKVESALGDNTRVRIEISSVNGLGNTFHKRRVAGIDWQPGKQIDPMYTRVLVIDWRDHPEKTQEWYDLRKAKYEREGLSHLFAQEVDRDYAASLSNTIIPRAWIVSAINAHVTLKWTPEQIGNNHMAGLDVADGGIDRNALVRRQGVLCRYAEEWGDRDPGVTARRSLVALRTLQRCKVMYDSIGVGAAVKAEYNRLRYDEKIKGIENFDFIPWNAGATPLEPKFRVIADDEESILNEDMFYNLKAQAWWSVRTRFYKTHRAVTDGIYYPIEELISLDGSIPCLYQLIDELAQPQKKENTSSLRMLVDKQPEGMKSPNLGDAFVMCYFPVPEDRGVVVGGQGS